MPVPHWELLTIIWNRALNCFRYCPPSSSVNNRRTILRSRALPPKSQISQMRQDSDSLMVRLYRCSLHSKFNSCTLVPQKGDVNYFQSCASSYLFYRARQITCFLSALILSWDSIHYSVIANVYCLQTTQMAILELRAKSMSTSTPRVTSTPKWTQRSHCLLQNQIRPLQNRFTASGLHPGNLFPSYINGTQLPSSQ